MGKLRAVWDLSWQDRWVLAEAWVMLLFVDIGLRFLSFSRLQRFAATVKEAHHQNGTGMATVKRAQRLVGIAARRHLYPMTCLRQALALQRLLGERGIETTLQIGVRREARELDAHAWLEYEGVPIGQPPDVMDRFTVLKAAGTK